MYFIRHTKTQCTTWFGKTKGMRRKPGMYSHFPAVCMLISQRKTHNFPPLLKDPLVILRSYTWKLSFPLCPLAGVGQSQMTWKVSHGCWLLVPVYSKYCLTPGCLNLRLVQEEERARLCAHTCLCIFACISKRLFKGQWRFEVLLACLCHIHFGIFFERGVKQSNLCQPAF